MSAPSYDRWIPTVVQDGASGPTVEWFLRGRVRLDGTNFADLVQHQLNRPFNHAFARRTSLDELDAIADASPSLPLSGIIAHTSRCGSTLVAKMLAGSGRVRVASEVVPIDRILRLGESDTSPDKAVTIARLRAMAKIFGRPGSDRETHYVLKLDAWQTADLPLLARAFPQTPWIYLYRDPLEVMVSHAEGQSYMMSAAHAHVTLGLSVVEAMQVPRAELCARVLERVGENAIAAGANAERLVNYTELPEAVVTRIAPAFGLPLDETSVAAMRATTGMHAKRPGEIFAPDASEKRDRATPEIREAAERLAPLYQRFEALRGA